MIQVCTNKVFIFPSGLYISLILFLAEWSIRDCDVFLQKSRFKTELDIAFISFKIFSRTYKQRTEYGDTWKVWARKGSFPTAAYLESWTFLVNINFLLLDLVVAQLKNLNHDVKHFQTFFNTWTRAKCFQKGHKSRDHACKFLKRLLGFDFLRFFIMCFIQQTAANFILLNTKLYWIRTGRENRRGSKYFYIKYRGLLEIEKNYNLKIIRITKNMLLVYSSFF